MQLIKKSLVPCIHDEYGKNREKKGLMEDAFFLLNKSLNQFRLHVYG